MLYEIVYFLIVKITLWAEFVAKLYNQYSGNEGLLRETEPFYIISYLSNVSYLRFICPQYLPRAVVLEDMQYKTTPDEKKKTKSGRHENWWVKNQAYFSDFCGNMTVRGLKNSVFTNVKKTKSAVC